MGLQGGLYRQALRSKFLRKDDFMDHLEQTGADCPMDLHRNVNNLPSDEALFGNLSDLPRHRLFMSVDHTSSVINPAFK